MSRDRPDPTALWVGAVLVAALCAILPSPVAPAIAAAGAGPVAISVSPARLVLNGADQASLRVINSGRARAILHLSVGNYTISPAGQIRVDPRLEPGRSSKDWLSVRPRSVVLQPGAAAAIQVRSRPRGVARPGDHHALVLVAGVVNKRGTVRVKVRVGVQTLVRVGGPLKRRLRTGAITLRRFRSQRVIRLKLRNDGNVTERLTSREAELQLRRGRRVVAHIPPQERSLLPGTGGYLLFRYRGPLRGRLTAVIHLRPSQVPGVHHTPAPVTRRRRLRL